MADKLDRADWIHAGFAMLAAGGIDAVRVERLAAVLKVTKGSFYWHFRDRPNGRRSRAMLRAETPRPLPAPRPA